MVVLDPIQAFIGHNRNMTNAVKMREILSKLSKVAAETNCAIVLVGHMNKSGGGNQLYRGLGSIDIAAAARSILMVSRDKEEPWKSKKNNHDRNQYRQTDHHEAIVSREIYNAAQKMLDASKYMKKGYPLPTLQVVDQGALKGFVPVNRAWNGFSSADYEKASLSAYSENNNEICAEKTENRGFDLSGYEIVRAQFFSTRFDPAVTISSGKIVFNTACLKKFEDVEYVELLFNSVEKCIAVRPCERSSINAIKWGTIRDGRWAVLPKSCKGFSEPLYELMGWNKDCKYKLRGQFCGTADEQVMIFELEEPEVLVREKAEEQFAEETEKKPEDAQKPIKKILYPEAWAYNFGESTNRTVFLQRVAYRGNWDILRPARTVEGMEIITREVLDDLLESAEKLIDKMRCANYA